MLDREPFLKAIFAAPDDDLPRLVFADWLDDHDQHDWAELIRIQCASGRRVPACTDDLAGREKALAETVWGVLRTCRGRVVSDGIQTDAGLLAAPDEFRRVACRNPHWYGADRLNVFGGRVADPVAVETLLRSPVTERVTALDLSGREEHLGPAHDDALGMRLIDFVYRPTITTRMVEHLCGLREARRLVALDLSRNDLDNDAVRALVRSTNLIRLTELTIQDGNTRVKGRLWGELRERFGAEVVR